MVMTAIRVLVANEPRSYREVIANVLGALRPQLEVIVVDPDDLDREVAELVPHLVLCSRATEVVETRAQASVTLYPDGRSHAVISIGGERELVSDVEFEHLLAAADQVERLVQMQ